MSKKRGVSLLTLIADHPVELKDTTDMIQTWRDNLTGWISHMQAVIRYLRWWSLIRPRWSRRMRTGWRWITVYQQGILLNRNIGCKEMIRATTSKEMFQLWFYHHPEEDEKVSLLWLLIDLSMFYAHTRCCSFEVWNWHNSSETLGQQGVYT